MSKALPWEFLNEDGGLKVGWFLSTLNKDLLLSSCEGKGREFYDYDIIFPMQDNLPEAVLQFCKKELEHLQLEQEFVLHELSEYKDEKEIESPSSN